ncbi:MAG TPA: nicotinamide mononucleotide transporter family protein, partial [Ferruginibacter sp.]|nr:nicotinamide mononucleotide transporter family protein [Ferruginibacter sp.]
VGVSIEGEGISSVIQSSITKDWTELLSLRSPEGTNGNQEISFLKFDGQKLSTFWGIAVSGRSNVRIHDCTIEDFSDRGVIFDGRNDNVEAAPEIFATGNKFYNNILNNCAAYNTPTGKYGRGCLNIGGQDGILIYNNTITQTQRPVGYNGFAIKYSNDGYLKNVKIYNNSIIKVPFMGNYGGDDGWDFAIEFWNVLGGMEIYNNTIQGAVDFVKTSKDEAEYGVWFHHNKIGQKLLNKHFESGLIFEVSTDAVIIENNIFTKLAGGIIFYTEGNRSMTDITIRNNRFEEIGSKTGNGNNGNGINISRGVVIKNEASYYIDDLQIYNNSFIAAENNAPLYGIEISGAENAAKIFIQNNTIKNFNVAPVFANPGFAIDSLVVANNILMGNGNNNKPFFISGLPRHYIFEKNKIDASIKTPGFNFKQQIIRPVYYELKNSSVPEFIAIVILFIALWFCSKENIYSYLSFSLMAIIFLFACLDEGESIINTLSAITFSALCIYGWLVWRRRNRRGHRIVRISMSSKKEIALQLLVFSSAFIFLLIANWIINKNAAFKTIALMAYIVYATALTGFWLTANKKLESWYWYLTSCFAAIFFYYAEHFLIYSFTAIVLMAVVTWCLFAWKKKLNFKRNTTSHKISA